MVAEETLVPVGASASIHCETITQQFSLKWQKDRRPLSVDERYESSDSADGYKHTLTIHGVRQGDEGEYGVIIADSYTAVTRITVIG
uniref:Ig-like domain-containing protein n=1 Tax=Parascaris equorum TaxID=6256 RepID=A0A914RKC9_PAREQ